MERGREVAVMTRGGPRKGAGRKPRPEERKIPMAIKIDREMFDYLETVESKTAAIEDALRRSQGFKVWKRERE